MRNLNEDVRVRAHRSVEVFREQLEALRKYNSDKQSSQQKKQEEATAKLNS
jgi:hypothetical protein